MSNKTVVRITFNQVISPGQSLKVFKALKYIVTHRVHSLRPAIVAYANGQGFILVLHDLKVLVNKALVARKLAGVLGLSIAAVTAAINVTAVTNIDVARAWVRANSSLFEGAQVWRYPVDTTPQVEPTKPVDWPEGEPWPRVSQPLKWTETPEETP